MSSLNTFLAPYQGAIARLFRAIKDQSFDERIEFELSLLEEAIEAFFSVEDFEYGFALADPPTAPTWYIAQQEWGRFGLARGPEQALALLLEQCAKEGRVPDRIDYMPRDLIKVHAGDSRFTAALMQPVRDEAPAGRRRVEATLKNQRSRFEVKTHFVSRFQRLGLPLATATYTNIDFETTVPQEGYLLIRTPNALAQQLRDVVESIGLGVSTSQSQELLARMFGAKSWQHLLANTKQAERHLPPAAVMTCSDDDAPSCVTVYSTFADAVWSLNRLIRAFQSDHGYTTRDLRFSADHILGPNRDPLIVPRPLLVWEGVRASHAPLAFSAEQLLEVRAEQHHQDCAHRLVAARFSTESMQREFDVRTTLLTREMDPKGLLAVTVAGWSVELGRGRANSVKVLDEEGSCIGQPSLSELVIYLSFELEDGSFDVRLESHDEGAPFERIHLPPLRAEEVQRLLVLLGPALPSSALRFASREQRPVREDYRSDHGFDAKTHDYPVEWHLFDSSQRKGVPGAFSFGDRHYLWAQVPIPVKGFSDPWIHFAWVEVSERDYAKARSEPQSETIVDARMPVDLGLTASTLNATVSLDVAAVPPRVTALPHNLLNQPMSARAVGELVELYRRG